MSTRVWTIDEMKRFAEQTKGADVTGLRFASDIIRQLITMVEKDSNNADVTISEVKKNILVAKVAKAIGAKEHSAKNAIRAVAETDDDSVAFCTLLEMLNQVKERIRTTNYTLDKYSTQTFDLMNNNDRAMVSIIGPESRKQEDPEARKKALRDMAEEARRLNLD